MTEPLEGWTVPCYQSIAQPHLLGGVSSTLMILLIVSSAIGVFWWWPLILLTGGIYAVAYVGTRYDVHFFEILVQHWRTHHHYEG